MSFVNLGLSSALCQSLARLGYSSPTPVQRQAIPLVISGRDLLVRAQTGTGKTAAFALPTIDRLLVAHPRAVVARRPRGLVLVPTRELAVQVQQALARYGSPLNLRVAAIFGGVAPGPQIQALSRGLDMIVATPGRLLDHLQQRAVDLSGVEVLVLDEADRMLDMGFLPPLRRILAAVPQNRQTLLLSATLTGDVLGLARTVTRDPARVDVSEAQPVASTVTHRVHPAPDGRKGELLARLLRESPSDQALVFCKTKRGSNRVGEQLARSGMRTAVINGNKSQNARKRALDDFKARRAMVLVATDIAARGLDVAQLPLVVNYDLPLVPEDYIHRIGRTGRAGWPGRAVSLVSPAERGLLADIQRLIPTPIEHVAMEGFDAAPLADVAPSAAPRAHHARRPAYRPGRQGRRVY